MAFKKLSFIGTCVASIVPLLMTPVVALAGALKDLSHSNLVRLIRIETLGSLQYGPDSAQWVSLTSNAQLVGDAGLINSLLDTMDEGDSCGV